MDVEPFLIPIGERCVPRTVEVLLFHSVPECQVHSAHNFGAALRPFLPQAKKISKYASQRWMKIETRKIELGCRLQIPIS
jgi:hypothetical protein